jgi:hypothetical protein
MDMATPSSLTTVARYQLSMAIAVDSMSESAKPSSRAKESPPSDQLDIQLDRTSNLKSA